VHGFRNTREISLVNITSVACRAVTMRAPHALISQSGGSS
jgi:hypothetical protein